MIRQSEAVFIDSGAWIALALSRDPLHEQAREQWDLLRAAGARLHTSVPVVIETFTFLDRNANRDVALAWQEWVTRPGALEILPCALRDLQRSWEYFRRSDLHRLSAVDATSGPNLTIRFAQGFPAGLACASLRNARANEHSIECDRPQRA